MAELALYHTEACHLCELAQALLDEAGVAYDKKDIIDDDALVDLYGLMIPVVKHRQSEVIIQWPFDLSQLQQWLSKIKH